jgi:hypothetical protein
VAQHEGLLARSTVLAQLVGHGVAVGDTSRAGTGLRGFELRAACGLAHGLNRGKGPCFAHHLFVAKCNVRERQEGGPREVREGQERDTRGN